jgi:hypothetical protein
MKRRSRLYARIFLLLFCGIRVFLSASSIPQDQNIELIREAIKAKSAHWTPKDTWVSRLSTEEFKRMLGDWTREREIVEPPCSPPAARKTTRRFTS